MKQVGIYGGQELFRGARNKIGKPGWRLDMEKRRGAIRSEGGAQNLGERAKRVRGVGVGLKRSVPKSTLSGGKRVERGSRVKKNQRQLNNTRRPRDRVSKKWKARRQW